MKYLIYGKHSKESDYRYLSKVADSKEEAVKLMEEYPRFRIIPEMVAETEVFKDCETFEQKLCKILNEIGLPDEIVDVQEKKFSIEITGDWKHEHLHTDCILKEMFGCSLISENVTKEDGSDFYTAIHTYLLP